MFGFEVSVLEMMNIGTLDGLGRHAAEALLKRATGEPGEGKEGQGSASQE